MKQSGPEMTTYLIEFKNGKRQKITVPSSWKVTFGPAVAGANKADDRGRTIPMAIRFYESENKQRAIFTDVASFRDTSIEIVEEQINIQEKQGFVEVDGQRKATSFRAETRDWVNPDVISPQKLLPPKADED
jgi:hypothetical protein